VVLAVVVSAVAVQVEALAAVLAVEVLAVAVLVEAGSNAVLQVELYVSRLRIKRKLIGF
jgi:hypothetical protein